MESTESFIDILYNRTCFFCFKIFPEMMKVTEVLEIRGPTSVQSISLSEIVEYMFPTFDIICTQACKVCSDLLIKMYVTMHKNNYITNLLTIWTEHSILIEKQNNQNPVTLDMKTPVRKTKINAKTNESNKRKDTSKRKFKRKLKYNCNHCTYISLCKGTLEGHINKYHMNVRPFSCNICHKSYYTKSNLIEHKQKHTDRRVCEVCGVGFNRKESLKDHLKLHSNIKTYKCMLCDKLFVNSGRRLEHIKRKHQDKTETCMFCKKGFGMKKDLMRHMKSVHVKI